MIFKRGDIVKFSRPELNTGLNTCPLVEGGEYEVEKISFNEYWNSGELSLKESHITATSACFDLVRRVEDV